MGTGKEEEGVNNTGISCKASVDKNLGRQNTLIF